MGGKLVRIPVLSGRPGVYIKMTEAEARRLGYLLVEEPETGERTRKRPAARNKKRQVAENK